MDLVDVWQLFGIYIQKLGTEYSNMNISFHWFECIRIRSKSTLHLHIHIRTRIWYLCYTNIFAPRHMRWQILGPLIKTRNSFTKSFTVFLRYNLFTLEMLSLRVTVNWRSLKDLWPSQKLHTLCFLLSLDWVSWFFLVRAEYVCCP